MKRKKVDLGIANLAALWSVSKRWHQLHLLDLFVVKRASPRAICEFGLIPPVWVSAKMIAHAEAGLN
jgi:hypothetical protein